MIEVTIMGGLPMERDASREPFGFAMAVLLGSTRGPTSVNKFALNALQCILTLSFIDVDVFSILFLYVFSF